MKKTYIALAASAAFAVAGTAAADGHGGSLSISANYQAQVMSVDADVEEDGIYMNDGTFDGRSNWGRVNIGGSHDLGNGMRAVYGLNTNVGMFGFSDPGDRDLDADDVSANDIIGNRKVFAGLAGDFGTIRLGRLNTSYNTAGKDPLNATFMQARAYGGMLGGAGGYGNGGYRDGVVRYDSSFGDVAVSASLLTDAASDGDEEHGFAAFVEAPVGPVGVYAAVMAAEDTRGWDGARGSDATKLGVTYSDGPMSFLFQYEDVDFWGGDEQEHMLLSGQFELSADSSVVVNYGMEDERDVDYIAAGYLQDMGENTRFHVGFMNSDNGAETTVIGGGLRVSF